MSTQLSPSELGKLFKNIDKNSSAPLKELAKIAGLDVTIDYVGADFSGENFDGEDLSNVNFTNCNVANASFVGANIKDTIFTGSNISPTQLKDCLHIDQAIM